MIAQNKTGLKVRVVIEGGGERGPRYHVHTTLAVHGNDRRDDIDLVALMAETKVDRKLW